VAHGFSTALSGSHISSLRLCRRYLTEGTKFHKLLFEGLEELGFGKWGFSADPYEMARMMIAHINKKRKALGIDKARERVLTDMSDRRALEAA